jgi:type I restriction enzyme S subunit
MSGASHPLDDPSTAQSPPADDVPYAGFDSRLLAEAFALLPETKSGIERLRSLIVELAIRGRLVPQLAGETLPRWVCDASGTATVPFDIPPAWRCLRLDEIAELAIGKTPPTKDSRYWSDDATGSAWVSIGDMSHRGTVVTTGRRISNSAAKEIFRDRIVSAGTLVMSFKLTIGKIAFLGCDAFHNEAITSITPRETEMQRFLFWTLPKLAPLGASNAAVKGATLNRESLGALPIPFPPIGEQKRIVAKVDQLMALCDELEARQSKKRDISTRLTKSALESLTTAEDPEEFDVVWKRVVDNFDVLIDRSEQVANLRTAILAMAFAGYLHRQNSTDEPAYAALDRIAAARGGSPRVERSEAELERERPSSLPTTWAWCRVDAFATVCLGGTPKRDEPRFWNGAVPWVSSGEVANCHIGRTRETLTHAGLDESNAKLYPAGTVLIAMIGEGKTRGQSALLDIEAATNQNVAGLVFQHGNIHPPYIWFWALSEYARTRAEGRGGAQPALNGRKIRALMVPLAPLPEQKRIAARIKRLLVGCDELEARLTDAEERASKLVEAVVRELVA